MPTYAVRTIVRCKPFAAQGKKFLYEERMTAWKADSFEQAIDEAEREAGEYAGEEAEVLDLFQAYELPEEAIQIPQGTEVFSLMRESDLTPTEYLDAFFDTGEERQGNYSDPG